MVKTGLDLLVAYGYLAGRNTELHRLRFQSVSLNLNSLRGIQSEFQRRPTNLRLCAFPRRDCLVGAGRRFELSTPKRAYTR